MGPFQISTFWDSVVVEAARQLLVLLLLTECILLPFQSWLNKHHFTVKAIKTPIAAVPSRIQSKYNAPAMPKGQRPVRIKQFLKWKLLTEQMLCSLHGLDPVRAASLVLKHSIKPPCLEAKMTPFTHYSMKHPGGRKNKWLSAQLLSFKDKSSSGWLFSVIPLSVEHTKIKCPPAPQKKDATSTFMKFINLQTPGQVYHSLFCTSKQSSIQKHAKSGMVQKEPAKFKKLASIKTIPIFLGRGFLSCVCWHFQRPCTWVKHTETTWQGHNKTGAKYYLIQITQRQEMIMGWSYSTWWAILFCWKVHLWLDST